MSSTQRHSPRQVSSNSSPEDQLQSRTDKIDKKSKLFGVFPETIGIDRNPLKELPDQFSAHPIELFPFKLPFKEYGPQILAEP